MSREPAIEQIAYAQNMLMTFRYSDALSAAQIALAELEDGPDDKKLIAKAHELAGQAALNCGEYFVAEEHIRKAANLLHELGENKRLLNCRCVLSECVSRQGDLRGARHQAIEVLEEAKSGEWPEVEARASNCLGNIAWQEGKLEESESYLMQAIELFTEIGDLHLASSARSSLGIVYILQNREEEAIELLQSAIRVFQASGDSARMVRCLNNLAGFAFQSGDSERAREYLLECVELEQDMQDRGDLVQSWYNLGVIEMHHQHLGLARKYFHRAKHLAQDVGDRSTEGAALIQLGIAALLDSDPNEAMNFLLLSEALLVGSPSTTAHIVLLYKPVFFLANGHFEIAADLWNNRPKKIDFVVQQALCDLLTFLLTDKFQCSVNEEAQFQQLGRMWLSDCN